jgi:hypothetical protein
LFPKAGEPGVSRRRTPVTVTTRSSQEIAYPWVTSARVDRRGNLRLYQGLSQRVFHPAGEWVRYTVAAAVPARQVPLFKPRMD